MPEFSSIQFFPPTRRAKYPHMMPLDVEVWERFLDQYASLFLGFAYDVHVGTGMNPDPEWLPSIQRDAKRLTQYRIDVLAQTTQGLFVIEVKPRPAIGVLGQVLGYMTLFKADFNPSAAVYGAVVAQTIETDLRMLLTAQGITAWTV